MTAQAIAGVLAGALIVTLVVLVIVERSRRDALVDAWARREELAERGETVQRLRGDVALEAARRDRADRLIEELELDAARRREGPILEGETVALTTPGDRTIRGVVRQTFDDGSVLLGAAIVYVERQGRDGGVEVEELDAGDVVVPVHRWAQKLPPAPVPED